MFDLLKDFGGKQRAEKDGDSESESESDDDGHGEVIRKTMTGKSILSSKSSMSTRRARRLPRTVSGQTVFPNSRQLVVSAHEGGQFHTSMSMYGASQSHQSFYGSCQEDELGPNGAGADLIYSPHPTLRQAPGTTHIAPTMLLQKNRAEAMLPPIPKVSPSKSRTADSLPDLPKVKPEDRAGGPGGNGLPDLPKVKREDRAGGPGGNGLPDLPKVKREDRAGGPGGNGLPDLPKVRSVASSRLPEIPNAQRIQHRPGIRDATLFGRTQSAEAAPVSQPVAGTHFISPRGRPEYYMSSSLVRKSVDSQSPAGTSLNPQALGGSALPELPSPEKFHSGSGGGSTQRNGVETYRSYDLTGVRRHLANLAPPPSSQMPGFAPTFNRATSSETPSTERSMQHQVRPPSAKFKDFFTGKRRKNEGKLTAGSRRLEGSSSPEDEYFARLPSGTTSASFELGRVQSTESTESVLGRASSAGSAPFTGNMQIGRTGSAGTSRLGHIASTDDSGLPALPLSEAFVPSSRSTTGGVENLHPKIPTGRPHDSRQSRSVSPSAPGTMTTNLREAPALLPGLPPTTRNQVQSRNAGSRNIPERSLSRRTALPDLPPHQSADEPAKKKWWRFW